MNIDERSKAKYQPWDQEQFSADIKVRKMTSVQRWIYKSLLQEAFVCSARPNLPSDDNELWMLSDCDSLEQWLENKEPIVRMFDLVEINGTKVLYHKRLNADWERVLEIREARAEAGRKGAEARSSKRKQDSAIAQQSSSLDQQLVSNEMKGNESKLSNESEGEGMNAADPSQFEDKDTDIMNPVREIPKISENILGVEVKIYPSDATRVKELTAVHGGTRVTNDYTDWCHENVGVYSRPLPEYLKVASERLRGAISPATDKAVIDIARELTYLSDNTVTFNNMNKLGLSELTKAGWTQPEIEAAWGDFFQKMDKDNPRNFEFAAKNFLEGADGLLYGNRKKKQKAALEQAATSRAKEVLEAQGVSDREERKRAREAEEALVEDVLE